MSGEIPLQAFLGPCNIRLASMMMIMIMMVMMIIERMTIIIITIIIHTYILIYLSNGFKLALL